METSSREAVLVSLRGLRLMEFDWDGAGGLPLRGDVADTVHDLYTTPVIEDEIDLALPMPVVSLATNGTIEVAYTEAGRQLLLTFECLGVISYIKVFEDDQTTVEGVVRLNLMLDVNPDDFVELTELFAWLIAE